MQFRAPASLLLRRAQLVLMLVTVLPTVAMTALGIVLLAIGSTSMSVVAGVLVLAFCTTALTGYILVTVFVSRGASLTRMQSEFLSSVSHELRTPLTSMQMFVETLKDGRVTDETERRTCLETLHSEMKRLDGLVSKLLELSRIETGRAVFKRGPVSAREVVGDALAAFRAASLTEPVEVEVVVVAEPAELVVQGDRAALAQAVGNLLTNAWKYGTRPDGPPSIRVHVQPLGRRHVEIAVVDRGLGVPPEDHERIFEHFERGRAALDGGAPGSGLGLAIVRGIVRAHHGRVDLSSEPGGGARFAIVLPRANPSERGARPVLPGAPDGRRDGGARRELAERAGQQ